ncbi:MAG: NAD-dependent epimerase/dehydratase family protein [Clostridia bacterium]
MKCIVTGAAGYLGSVLVRTLFEAGYQVSSFVLPSEETDHIADCSTLVYGDVLDEASLRAAFQGMDCVVHMAGIIDIGSGKGALMHRVNVGGTQNVIRACQLSGVKRLVYASSVHAIPEKPGDQSMDEVAHFDPALVYGEYAKTKAEATNAVLGAKSDALQVVVVHPSGVIGPDERTPSNLGTMITAFLCGELTAYPAGRYSFVDVRDVARGTQLAIERGLSGECYILGGHVVTVEQMLRVVSETSQKPMLKTCLPHWFVLGTSYLAELYYKIRKLKPLYTHYSIVTLFCNCNFSSKKAEEKLGLTFRPYEESLRDMTQWILAHFVVKEGDKFKRCAYRP